MDPGDVRNALRRQIGSARRALRRKEGLTDEAIHVARKELKRARASLRLLRDGIGDTVYARENALLRDAARPLAPVRDAKVTLEALDRLTGGDGTTGNRAALRRALLAQRRRARRELRASGIVAETGRSLAEAARRVKTWRLPRDGTSILRAGLMRIYRRGRKALAAARSSDNDESLHEARKQVKYLEKAMETLRPVEPRRVAKAIRRAKSVADRLGDDHDFAVLQGRIAALPLAVIPRASTALLSEIGDRRRKLQGKALRKARRVYKKKPRAVVERVTGWKKG
jgi:CHAD domain-containing protein